MKLTSKERAEICSALRAWQTLFVNKEPGTQEFIKKLIQKIEQAR